MLLQDGRALKSERFKDSHLLRTWSIMRCYICGLFRNAFPYRLHAAEARMGIVVNRKEEATETPMQICCVCREDARKKNQLVRDLTGMGFCFLSRRGICMLYFWY